MLGSKKQERVLQMSSEIAIDVQNLSKCYQIYEKPRDRLKQFILPIFYRAIGKSQKNYFREFWALHDVSFKIQKGETLGVIGRNGSGKSTLLQLICGILNPSNGNLKINGRVAALLELGSGFNPEFTGKENIYLNANILGLSAQEIDDRYEQIIGFADIGDFINHPVKTYSSGMVVRLAFAVASSVDPEILIVDEALAVGDAEFQAKCYRRFKELRDGGVTVILVTHDISSVIQLCNRAIVLHKGKLVASGLPKEMGDEYRRLCAEESSRGYVKNIEEPTKYTDYKADSSAVKWLPKSTQTQEYGNGRAKIEYFSIYNLKGDVITIINSDEPILLKMRIKFFESCLSPIAAFGIRDLTGLELSGTNTWYEGKDIGSVKSGEVVTVDFNFQTNLQSGIYNLTMACTELSSDGLNVLHRLFDVAVLEINATRRFVGRYDLKPVVHVNREKNLDENITG